MVDTENTFDIGADLIEKILKICNVSTYIKNLPGFTVNHDVKFTRHIFPHIINTTTTQLQGLS